MPARSGEASTGETCSSSGTRKTKCACIVEADESSRKRFEGTLHKDHEDHIAGKGINSLNHYNIVHKLILVPQEMKILEAKETGEEIIMAKSRPTLKMESKTESSSASNCPGVVEAPSPSLSLAACAGRTAAEDSNQNDAASSSQVWQSDVESNASAGRLAAEETNQNLDFLASAVKPAADGSGIVDVDSVRPNNFHMSVARVPHLERVYSNLRQKIGRKSGDDMNDLDTNSLMWGMFMSAALDAAVHFGKLLFGELKFYQKSETTNGKTNVRRVTKVDHRSNRDSRFFKDWVAHTPLAKDNFVDRQSSSVIDSKSLCIL